MASWMTVPWRSHQLLQGLLPLAAIETQHKLKAISRFISLFANDGQLELVLV